MIDDYSGLNFLIADIKDYLIMSSDWNTVTVIGNRKGGNTGNVSKERQLNLARRQGAAIATESKYEILNSYWLK